LREKETGKTGEARRSRDERLVEGVRWRMARDGERIARLRRLERMEQAARVWVNGREVGGRRYAHLAESYD
jgi:hypothetical protein